MTSYSPVVKAESFACTKNSSSGHVVARLRVRVRTEREKRYSCEMVDLEPEDYQQRQNWATTTPFNFEVLHGANNHQPFLPIFDFQARVATQNELLCVDKGCESADFAR